MEAPFQKQEEHQAEQDNQAHKKKFNIWTWFWRLSPWSPHQRREKERWKKDRRHKVWFIWKSFWGLFQPHACLCRFPPNKTKYPRTCENPATLPRRGCFWPKRRESSSRKNLPTSDWGASNIFAWSGVYCWLYWGRCIVCFGPLVFICKVTILFYYVLVM